MMRDVLFDSQYRKNLLNSLLAVGKIGKSRCEYEFG